MAAAALLGLVQTQALVAPEAIKPDIKKLNPLEGRKNIFAKPKTYIALALSGRFGRIRAARPGAARGRPIGPGTGMTAWNALVRFCKLIAVTSRLLRVSPCVVPVCSLSA